MISYFHNLSFNSITQPIQQGLLFPYFRPTIFILLLWSIKPVFVVSFHDWEHVINVFHFFVELFEVGNLHLNLLYSLFVFLNTKVLYLHGSYRMSLSWMKVEEPFGNVECSEDTESKNNYLRTSTKNRPKWDCTRKPSTHLDYFLYTCQPTRPYFWNLIWFNNTLRLDDWISKKIKII